MSTTGKGSKCPMCGCQEPPARGFENWHVIHEGEGDAVPSLDFAPDGRSVVAAVIRSGGFNSFSTVVTSERRVGSIEVDAICVVLDHLGKVVQKDGEAGLPQSVALRVRLSVPSGGLAMGLRAEVTLRPGGGRLQTINCAVAIEPNSFVYGCVQLAEYKGEKDGYLSYREVEDAMDPYSWTAREIDFLAGLLDFEGLTMELRKGEAP